MIVSRRSLVHAGLAVAAAASLGIAPAGAAEAPRSAADKGLYGSQDPTFDGVYRQGLAIAGLAAIGRRAPKPGVDWLLAQQCRDGSFQAYRADTSIRCAPADPVNFTGPDTNSTALAAMALRAAGRKAEANAAIGYLRRAANPDGGFPYIPGGVSDANSTGLTLSALRGAGESSAAKAKVRKRAERYLRSVQLGCSAERASRGLFSFQADPLTGNDLATVQATLGLLTTWPVTSVELPDDAGPLRCADGKAQGKPNAAAAALAALKARLAANKGLLPSSAGTGGDPSATAQAVLALAAADVYPRQQARAVKRLKKVAESFTEVATAPVPGAVGTLLLVAAATDADPRDFGSVNLVRALAESRR